MSNEDVTSKVFKMDDAGMPTDELADNALETIKSLHAEHIGKAANEVSKADQDRIHKEAKFQTLAAAEQKLREDYSVTGKTIPEIVANVAKNAAIKAASDDSVLLHPIYLKLKNETDEQIRTVTEQAETAVRTERDRADRKERFDKVVPQIGKALKGLNLNLDDLPPASRDAYLMQFSSFDYEETESGTFMRDAQGLIKDSHKNPLKVESYVTQSADKWFVIPLQPARDSPGLDKSGTSPALTEWAKTMPTSTDKFNAWLDTVPPDQQGEAMKAFQERKV